MKYYAGIGSRNTPEDIGLLMTALAVELEKVGYVLRSGGAKGADTFFERGVHDNNNKQIFIHAEKVFGKCHQPQAGIYNAQRYSDYAEARALAANVHPVWYRCNDTARQLHTRNVYQVLGPEFLGNVVHSRFLVCWAIPDIHGVPEGGTRTAWMIAQQHGIKCYNLAVRADRDRIETWLALREAALWN